MALASVKEASQMKSCSDQAIRDAIRDKRLNGIKVGWSYVVEMDRTFSKWNPSERHQKAGKSARAA
jgi:hypothetical protein